MSYFRRLLEQSGVRYIRRFSKHAEEPLLQGRFRDSEPARTEEQPQLYSIEDEIDIQEKEPEVQASSEPEKTRSLSDKKATVDSFTSSDNNTLRNELANQTASAAFKESIQTSSPNQSDVTFGNPATVSGRKEQPRSHKPEELRTLVPKEPLRFVKSELSLEGRVAKELLDADRKESGSHASHMRQAFSREQPIGQLKGGEHLPTEKTSFEEKSYSLVRLKENSASIEETLEKAGTAFEIEKFGRPVTTNSHMLDSKSEETGSIIKNLLRLEKTEDTWKASTVLDVNPEAESPVVQECYLSIGSITVNIEADKNPKNEVIQQPQFKQGYSASGIMDGAVGESSSSGFRMSRYYIKVR